MYGLRKNPANKQSAFKTSCTLKAVIAWSGNSLPAKRRRDSSVV